ncbi:Clavaminate synthase-like protein [Rickenella mellea]|uniref:Clavaminate synthase-like protein n=1 Tax=Rickenella mellea TaxID=50990 RepID=A0A4Y7PWA1_9AGAM|nr:Clavaminate synthase-like protein [Rickenella mellea]
MTHGGSVLDASKTLDPAFHMIPIIDIKDAESPDQAARRRVALEIRDACINVGFFYVKTHGIPQATIDEAYEASKQFFALPLKEKLKIDHTTTHNHRGYNGLRSQNTDPENDGDMHEAFNMGKDHFDANVPDVKTAAAKGSMMGANIWPTESLVPGFRPAVVDYYDASAKLGKVLFPLFALALDLDEHFFDDKTKNSAANMRLMHYPPQTGPVDDRVIGIGAHTDYECFTILWQEPGIQALQVLNSSKEWINAPPIDGTLVVNLGDQFERWTNDIFKSTTHRAINRSGVERYSIPTFLGTDYDVKMEPIPSCVSAESPPKYEVMTSGEFFKAKVDASYAAR